MDSFSTHTNQKPRWSDNRQGGQRGPINYQGNTVETQLLPNEIRISAKGNFALYVKQILTTLKQGFKNCKLVARGNATSFAWDIVREIK